jgi:hypothetical protein
MQNVQHEQHRVGDADGPAFEFDAHLADGSDDHTIRRFRPSMRSPQPKNVHFFHIHDTQSRRIRFLAGADMKETSI